ncbi:MAG: hypothetical protein QW838_02850 [Candidatus Nitrosotenuis sp.]
MSFVSEKLLGVDVNEVSTTPKNELGAEIALVDGRVVRYVKAATAVAAGDALVIATSDAAAPFAVSSSSAAAQVLVGVAHVAIPAGSYGFITVRGPVTVKASAGTASGARLGTTATAGTLAALTASASYTPSELSATIAAASGVGVSSLSAESGGTVRAYLG